MGATGESARGSGRRRRYRVAAGRLLGRPDGECFPDAADAGIVHRLAGPLLERYREEGGAAGALGLPLADERAVTPSADAPVAAEREVPFEGGVVYLDASGTATTVRWSETPDVVDETPEAPEAPKPIDTDAHRDGEAHVGSGAR